MTFVTSDPSGDGRLKRVKSNLQGRMSILWWASIPLSSHLASNKHTNPRLDIIFVINVQNRKMLVLPWKQEICTSSHQQKLCRWDWTPHKTCSGSEENEWWCGVIREVGGAMGSVSGLGCQGGAFLPALLNLPRLWGECGRRLECRG